MEAGETLMRAEFASQADADFFKGQLRWSAFLLEQEGGQVADAEKAELPKRGPGRPPKPKIDSVSP
jgi:hypothetical protein